MTQPNGQVTPHRADRRLTVRFLVAGTIAAVAVFAVSLGLRLLGNDSAADTAGVGAVIVLLATPALGLGATALELKAAKNPAWSMALVVLLILAAAAVLALVAPN